MRELFSSYGLAGPVFTGRRMTYADAAAIGRSGVACSRGRRELVGRLMRRAQCPGHAIHACHAATQLCTPATAEILEPKHASRARVLVALITMPLSGRHASILDAKPISVNSQPHARRCCIPATRDELSDGPQRCVHFGRRFFDFRPIYIDY